MRKHRILIPAAARPPRTDEKLASYTRTNTADAAQWIQVFVGDQRVIWPASAVSKFNDWEAAY